jgi:hypothetical protein
MVSGFQFAVFSKSKSKIKTKKGGLRFPIKAKPIRPNRGGSGAALALSSKE